MDNHLETFFDEATVRWGGVLLDFPVVQAPLLTNWCLHDGEAVIVLQENGRANERTRGLNR